jgi:hypothetical protein
MSARYACPLGLLTEGPIPGTPPAGSPCWQSILLRRRHPVPYLTYEPGL